MTLRQIADAAGVSIGTVDRVLHGRGRVSAETRARVEGIVAESGFIPNPLAKHLRRGKGYRFAVLAPRADEDEGYWALAYAGARAASEALAAFDVAVDVREFDRYGLRSAALALEAALEGGYDGLLMAPTDGGELLPVLTERAADIPCVFFDALIPGFQPLCAIGQDGEKSGYLAGRIMSLLAPSARRLLAINPHQGDAHLSARLRGFRAWQIEHGRVDVSVSESAEGLEPAAWDGIFAANAALGGVIACLPPEGEPRPAVIGYDLVPRNVEALRAGRIDCLISQKPEFQAREGIMLLYRSVVLGEPPAPRIEAPLEIFLKENAPA